MKYQMLQNRETTPIDRQCSHDVFSIEDIHIEKGKADIAPRIVQRTKTTVTELDKMLVRAARECSADAVRRTFEAGRPITILVGNRIVRRWADGREELVKELPPR